MPAEAWIALGAGLVSMFGAIIGAVAYLSSQFTKAVTKFEVVDTVRAAEITRLNTVVEKIETAVSALAADRATVTALNAVITALAQRVTMLEQRFMQGVDHRG